MDGSGQESLDSNEASATPALATPTIAMAPVTTPIPFGSLPQTYKAILTVPNPSDPVPTGTSSLQLDGNTVATSSTYDGSAGGGQYSVQFSYSGPALTVGNHSVVVSFAGDANYNSVTSSPASSQQVVPASVSLAFPASAVNPDPSNVGTSVTYTVNLSTTVAAGVPAATGMVNFSAQNVATGVTTPLGSAPISGTGTNAYSAGLSSAAPLPTGTYTISASYQGDANYAQGSTATPATQTVQGPILNITYASAPPTLVPGTSAVLDIQVSNTGTLDDTTAYIQQTLPANTTFVPNLSSPRWSEVSPGLYQLSLASVPAGGSVDVYFAIATPAAAPAGPTVAVAGLRQPVAKRAGNGHAEHDDCGARSAPACIAGRRISRPMGRSFTPRATSAIRPACASATRPGLNRAGQTARSRRECRHRFLARVTG